MSLDHFAVQASERPGLSPIDAELDLFATYARAFAEPTILLVDTYDTERGIKHAVSATSGKLRGIRRDSNVSPETVKRAPALLAALGAPNAVDGFGVGGNIGCSPDAATGVGAVAKLVVNGYGKNTMLSPDLRALEPATHPWRLVASDALAHQIDRLTREATS